MLTLAAVAALVFAAVAISRRSPEPNDDVVPSAQLAAPAPAADAPVAAAAAVQPRAVSEASKKSPARVATKRAAESETSAVRVAAVPAIADTPEKKNAADTSAASEPTPTAPMPALASTDTAVPPPVTITGCLEISTDEHDFRLTDTEGIDAPKSRSWRTGFLKKRSTPVALVEAPDPLALKRSVGKRVAATGLLNSRELKVSSLRVVGAYCN